MMERMRRRTTIIITTTTLGCKKPLKLLSFLLVIIIMIFCFMDTCTLSFVVVVKAFTSSSSSSYTFCHPKSLQSRPTRHQQCHHYLFSTKPSSTMPTRRNHTETTRTNSRGSRRRQQYNDNDDDDIDNDFYDDFGDKFQRTLLQDDDDGDDSLSQSLTKTPSLSNRKHDDNNDNERQKEEEEEELSPYYRRDRRIPQQQQLHYKRRSRKLTKQLQEQAPQDEQEQHFVIKDPIALRQLLKDRYYARKQGDFERVARLDEVLRHEPHRVRVYDHPRIWSLIDFFPQPPLAHYRHRASKLAAALQNMHGPKRHGYQYSCKKSNNNINSSKNAENDLLTSIVCSLTEPEIHTALSRRTLCRQQGRYEQADAIRFELWMHGVQVNDDAMTWSFSSNDDHDDDGDQFHSPPTSQLVHDNDRINNDSDLQTAASTLEYQEKDNGDIDDDGDNNVLLHVRARQRVEHLVAIRANALVCGNQQEAAFLALELYKTYHVILDDDCKTWSVRPNVKRYNNNSKTLTSVNNTCSISMPSFALLSKFWPPTVMTESMTLKMSLLFSEKYYSFPPRLFTMEESKSRQYKSPSYCLSRQSLPLALVDDNRDVNDATEDNDDYTKQETEELQRMYMSMCLQERIQGLIQERIHRREEAKYIEADALRKELWYTYHVGVNDRLQQYSVGGVYDE